jgi:hypothetical protein
MTSADQPASGHPGDPVDPSDIAAIELQLGRTPRGVRGVAHRCPCGLPDVVRTAPRLEDGTPFPTLYYLTCPRAASAIGRMENSGRMREMQDALAEDPDLRAAYTKAHESYIAERCEQVLFSDPDYCIEESLAVEEGNPHDIVDYTSFVDNTDITIAVASGTVEEGYAEDAGIADDQIRTYAGIDQMYAALAAGEIDAVTGTNATVQGQVRAREGIEAVDPFFPVTEEGEEILPCGGYGFRLDDQEFRDEFNAQLNQLREDGTTWELISPYQDQDGPSEEDVEQANQLTVEDFQE